MVKIHRNDGLDNSASKALVGMAPRDHLAELTGNVPGAFCRDLFLVRLILHGGPFWWWRLASYVILESLTQPLSHSVIQIRKH